jgi:uncharacterized protein YecT (DUF1311 family)
VFELIAISALALTQPADNPLDLGLEGRRPALECSAHLRDDRARRACLRDLMRAAEDDLSQAVASARSEAGEVDMGAGAFGAADQLEAAQQAWTSYRDAECERRASLMMIGQSARDELASDCRIALTRARADELRAY